MLFFTGFVKLFEFTINEKKCEEQFYCLELQGLILSTESEFCTPSISEECILTVQAKLAELKAEWGPPGLKVLGNKVKGLPGQLALCGQAPSRSPAEHF
ncbi:hypothetical protein CYMTET_28385 [Cymbomonas tetramitiformis]|uniref:Uncharacterized protein n=1 Tax=Cymbomonas tetramitiformis TaxID=36881 RepID=A0AAE0FMX3_9CHLO|nr:hypothetical protein CYMTET_28385 [Cymbomonas tetramitiformis]